MNNNIFNLNNFNIIEDEEFYYVFRALNNDDYEDIITGKTVTGGKVTKIRTNCERYEETTGRSRYYGKNISLREVYDHIRIHHTKDTNCISLSSNANVSIDYGKNYHEQYIMVKIPKTASSNIYEAGKYMLDEVNKIINQKLKTVDDILIKKLIEEIEIAKNYDEVNEIINKYITSLNDDNIKFIKDRFTKKQCFSKEQQLQYNKIVAKLTILEVTKILPSILNTNKDNSSLLATISNAFSSSELIHYGQIEEKNFIPVSSRIMSILALIQQLKENDKNNNNIKEIEDIILKYIKEGYDIKNINNKICLVNVNNIIDLNLSLENANIFENISLNKENLSIEKIYKLTKGRIRCEKTIESLDFVYNLTNSKRKAYCYSKILNSILNNSKYDNEIKQIEKLYDIDSTIIDRQNNIGKKITESVSIGMNKEGRRFFSNLEQKKIIDLVENMSIEEQNQLLSGKLNVTSIIIDQILEKEHEISENEYYIEAIVEGLDFNKIYKNSILPRTMTDEEKLKISNKLFVGDCKNLYNAFLNAGVNRKNIPNYIINLYIEKGYKGYNFEELSKHPELFDIIKKNIHNLNHSILPIELDKMLEIEDNENKVEDTYINLRDYQLQAVDNVNSLYESGKRFAGVVLPTGAGKSFVAMTIMLNYSNSNIVYFAPNQEILRQIERHIVRYIINHNKTNEEKEEALNQPENYRNLIREKFPHLKLYCYQGLSSKEEEELEKMDANLIILDELHRTGATTWNPKIEKLIEKNKNAKILGLTATPTRDVDKRDMMLEIAKLTNEYSTRELLFDKHLAINMNILDAMKDKIVVSPNIVAFDYNLEKSDEYKEIKRLYDNETDEVKKEKLGQLYSEMTRIIKNSKIKGIKGIINENIKKKDGKYIVFLPYKDTQNQTSEEYIKEQIEGVKEYFKDIDIKPEVEYLISDRKDKSENKKAIQKFESSNSKHLKLIFAIDMLNEGVHVDGIDGLVMLRPISDNSTILYLQQLGRSIYSLNPDNPIKDEDIPVIFDIYNNYLILNMERQANKTTISSDLQRFKAVYLWIEKHRFIPDIDSPNIDEARKAKILKNIKLKYEKYLEKEFSSHLTEKDIYQIKEILELGKKINLWNIEFKDRTIDPIEKELDYVDVFTAKGNQRSFMELAKESKQLIKPINQSEKMRQKLILSILDILVEYNYEININTINLEYTLKDIYKNLPKSAIELIEELGVTKDYEIGTEYNYIKTKFYNSKTKNVFTDFDLETLIKFGLFEPFIKDEEEYTFIDNFDFIKRGPSKFRGLNLKTKQIYDEEGFNEYGRNQYEFTRDLKNIWTNSYLDRHGFDYRGIHHETGTHIDKHGFDCLGYHYKEENNKYVKTDKRLDDRNFDQDGYWYDPDSWNPRQFSNQIYDKEGYDIEGFNKKGFNKEGLHRNGTLYDENGFNIEGLALREFKTGSKLYPINKYGFDVKGYYYKFVNKKYLPTGLKMDPYGFDVNGRCRRQPYNFRFFDRDGYYWKEKENNTGERIKTNRKVDDHGFNLNGYTMIIDETGQKKLSKIDKYGFDERGFWHKSEFSPGKSQYNPRGFKFNRLHKKTNLPYNENGFDIDGYFYENGVKTERLYNNSYFDIDGYYWDLNKENIRVKTNKKYDDEGYDINGLNKQYFNRNGEFQNEPNEFHNNFGFDCNSIHMDTKKTYDRRLFTGLENSKYSYTNLITGTNTDIRGFMINGEIGSTTDLIAYIGGELKIYNYYNGDSRLIYAHKENDGRGFDVNGIHFLTKTKFAENGYNAFNVDKDGKRKDHKVHPDIIFTKRYIKLLKEGMNPFDDEIINSYLEKKLSELENKISKERLFIIIIYASGEMYPPIKQELKDAIEELKTNIEIKKQIVEEKENQKQDIINSFINSYYNNEFSNLTSIKK